MPATDDAGRDPLHDRSEPHEHFTTANIGEALPGVLTPLGWTLWGTTIERTTRETLCSMGVFTRREAVLPPTCDGRITRIFHGRGALHIDAVATLGDRMPGTTGPQVVAGIFGESPDDIDYRPTRRRYPFIVWGLARNHFGIPGRLRAAAPETERWWRDRLGVVPALDAAGAVALFVEASDRFYRNVLLQTAALFCAVQPMYDALTRLTARTGVGDVTALVGGYGGVPEAAVVADLWGASRGKIDLAEVVGRHRSAPPMPGE